MTIEAGPSEMFTTLAEEADAAEVALLVNAAFRGDGSRRGWTNEADLVSGARTDVAAIAALIRSPGSAILVVRGQNGLRGCVHLESRAQGLAYLGMLAVRPAMQGSQFGRHLLAAGEHYARRELGAQRIEIAVLDAREELIGWYERRGYVQTGERRPFPYGDETGGVALRDDLEFVVLQRELGR